MSRINLRLIVAVIICCITIQLKAQVGISITGALPDNSAILDVSSTDKGVLIPRMTQAQRNAITDPATSLLIYQTDVTPGYYYNAGTPAVPSWQTFGGADNLGNHTATQALNMSNYAVNNIANPTDSIGAVNARTHQKGSLVYAADAGSSDAYAIALSPVIGAYQAGMVVHFKANTANTGAATLNVCSLGGKTIKKNYNSDLADNDILAGQLVSVIYDGINWQMLSPVANVPTGGGGGAGEINYPDGITGITPITRNNLLASPYTVPAGKNLYITSYFCPNSNDVLTAGGKILYRSYAQVDGSWGGTNPFNPFIVGQGVQVATTNDNDNNFNGFLVDATVTPVTINNLNSTPYTVPAGYTFVILNFYSMGSNNNFSVDNKIMYRGYANFNNNTSGHPWDNIREPVFVGEGLVIRSNVDDVTINGYLKAF